MSKIDDQLKQTLEEQAQTLEEFIETPMKLYDRINELKRAAGEKVPPESDRLRQLHKVIADYYGVQTILQEEREELEARGASLDSGDR